MKEEDRQSLLEVADIFIRSGDSLSISIERGLAAQIGATLLRIADDKTVAESQQSMRLPKIFAAEVEIAIRIQACPEADASLREIAGNLLATCMSTAY